MTRSQTTAPRRVAILGVGLLGGSVALSIRRQHPDVQLIGLVRDRSKGDALVARGLIDDFADSVANVCRDCDVVVVATPVDRLADFVIQAAKHSPSDCLITDVGSTKVEIVATVAADSLARLKFVAAHPIAGSEKSGADFATATLFDGKPVVLTPDTATPADLLQRATDFWTSVGGQTVVMSASEHDVHLASTSHVPHLVSALVARMVQQPAGQLVGSGWRDITRVAAGDPEMWTAICAANRNAILSEMERFAEHFDALKTIVASDDDDALHQWLAQAKETKLEVENLEF
ncbi:prephenate dehydrogenase [Rubripirellula obstinata]|uniref:Prephenate dehydrogenase n=1 Tax=Rubripirellula obstinata TaxID=406547 RepID=A0A5B1CKS2_9BACT|nr:prephenate dehydrogenase/arogenate dehydrogenase family protein [Rubripirellula obstinata]KAA1260932.1 prephenate dehydrogenase [Rubripirellula obstinata]